MASQRSKAKRIKMTARKLVHKAKLKGWISDEEDQKNFEWN